MTNLDEHNIIRKGRDGGERTERTKERERRETDLWRDRQIHLDGQADRKRQRSRGEETEIKREKQWGAKMRRKHV